MLTLDSRAESTAHRIALAERRNEADLSLFKQVVLLYNELGDLPPVAACSPDRDCVRGSIKWTPILFFFKHDVETATRVALGDRLFETWVKLTPEDPDSWGTLFDRDVLTQLVRRCARVYRERGLKPRTYFQPTRPGRQR